MKRLILLLLPLLVFSCIGDITRKMYFRVVNESGEKIDNMTLNISVLKPNTGKYVIKKLVETGVIEHNKSKINKIKFSDLPDGESKYFFYNRNLSNGDLIGYDLGIRVQSFGVYKCENEVTLIIKKKNYEIIYK